MTIRAVIWDMGGVLLRTENPQPRQALAESLGLSRETLEEIVFGGESGRAAQLGLISVDQHWQNVLRQLGLPAAERAAFEKRFWGGDRLDRELLEFIRTLRPRYKVGLLSNAFSDLRHYLTEIWGLADLFDAIIISAEVGVMKPDERIYRLAAEQLKVSPGQAVFLDDFERNVRGAQAVGMLAIHFREPEQARQELRALMDGAIG